LWKQVKLVEEQNGIVVMRDREVGDRKKGNMGHQNTIREEESGLIFL
jgi:hypothetical protein